MKRSHQSNFGRLTSLLLALACSWVPLTSEADPEVSIHRKGNMTIAVIGDRSVVPQGEALYPSYQLQISEDLNSWESSGERIPQRTGGDPETHSVEVELTEAHRFIRVAWYLDLAGMDLSSRDFRGADLRGADLTQTDLNHAKLEEADLRRADLTGADLTGVTLSGANLGGTVFHDASTENLVMDRVGGRPETEIALSIPDIPYSAKPDDYSENHPDLPGLPLSHNTAVLTFNRGTSIEEANRVFALVNAHFITGVRSGTKDGPGVVVLKLPTANHAEMTAALTRLRNEPAVALASCDVLLSPTALPAPHVGEPQDWTWDTGSTGGNWGLELSRVPQMWNLNDGLLRRGHVIMREGMLIAEREALRQQRKLTVTGVIDSGFFLNHPDLEIRAWIGEPDARSHGTHIAGTIAAFFGNGKGVDGINPFCYLAVAGDNSPSFGPLEERVSWAAGYLYYFHELADRYPDVRVINMSLAYNWWKTGINPNTTPAVTNLARVHGALFHALLNSMNHPPLAVVAAGNDYDSFPGHVFAWYASPMTSAGIEWQNPNVIVVEAVDRDTTVEEGVRRSNFSNLHGHISAPGGRIMSTSLADSDTDPPELRYDYKDGTSMAAPHVTGLASYLFTLDPSLTNQQVRDLITSNVQPASALPVAEDAASPRIDAFAAALAIDQLRSNDAILRMLVDIDDGTPDGNTRIELGSNTAFFNEDEDGNGGMGDGSIDMSDFRRFRDWTLDALRNQFEEPSNNERVHLDGANDHPKRDGNRNGVIFNTPEARFEDENVFPRGDFNGDGRLSLIGTATLPGFDDEEATDLDVLKKLFDDPVYRREDLSDALLQSFDFHIDPSICFNRPGVAAVRSSIRHPETNAVYKEYIHASASDTFIYTIPYDGTNYIAKVVALDANGIELRSSEKPLDLSMKNYGRDELWKPNCEAEPIIHLTFPENTPLTIGQSTRIRVRVDVPAPGEEFSPVAGARVEVYGFGFTALFGTTDDDGYYESTIRPDEEEVVLQVQVTLSDGATTFHLVNLRAGTRGAQVDVVALDGGEFEHWTLLSISENGTILFEATGNDGSRGLYTSQGSGYTAVPGVTTSGVGVIDDNGTIHLMGAGLIFVNTSGRETLAGAQDNSVFVLYRAWAGHPDDRSGPGFLTEDGERVRALDLNNNDVIAYAIRNRPVGKTGIWMARGGDGEILPGNDGAGVLVHPPPWEYQELVAEFENIADLGLNDSDELFISGNLDGSTAGLYKVRRGGAVQLIAANVSNIEFGALSVTNAGKIVVRGSLPSTSPDRRTTEALFLFHDGEPQKIVASNDPVIIDNVTWTFNSFEVPERAWMDGSGRIVFEAGIQKGQPGENDFQFKRGIFSAQSN